LTLAREAQVNDAVTPTLAFGDGDTGFFESADDTIRLSIAAGSMSWIWNNIRFATNSNNRFALLNEAPSATNPVLIPAGDDLDTGIGHAAADQLSLIAGGLEGIRITESGDAISSISFAGDLDLNGNNIDEGGVIFLIEQAEADEDVAGSGQIWVDLATPNVLMFTDDAGTDFTLNTAASATAKGQVELATIAETNIGTDTERAVTPDGLSGAKRSIMLTAQGGIGLTTAGCAGPTQVEAATNDINYWVLDFDTTTEEHAFWTFPMPDNWDAGVVNAIFYWTNAGGASAETVDWGIAGVCLSNDEAIDSALGTEITTTDTFIAQGDVHISAASADITIANAVAGELVSIVVARKTATDNMAGDARLIAVKLEYTINAYGE